MIRFLVWGLFWALLGTCALSAGEAEPVPVARLDPEASRIEDFGADLHVELALSQAVPWRAYTLDRPRRVVLDFSEVDFDGAGLHEILASDGVAGISMGRVRRGWSRLVLHLSRPYTIETAGISSGAAGMAAVKLQLAPTDPRSFSAEAGAPASALFARPDPSADQVARHRGARRVVVALDPGHGGIDPGAQAGEFREADLMLAFAGELKRALRRAGLEVVLTREDDGFVPLARRVDIARAAGADLLLSLHADAVAEERAGVAIYTSGAKPSDAASARLAARHDEADLRAGAEIAHEDARLEQVSFSATESETKARAERLADHLALGLARATGDPHRRRRLRADFSVLEASDIPSVLVELGFMSSPRDLANLVDPDWRAEAVEGILMAIEAWAHEAGREALLLRQ